MDTDTQDNFNNCNHDGSSDCSSSKCCEDQAYTCFTKNQYYSACAKKCNPNVVDSRGEKWNCIPKSASKCSILKPCVGACFGSAELEGAATASVKEVWDCSNYADAAECIDAHCKTPDAVLNKAWTKICNDNCAATPASKCPTKDSATPLTSCVHSCSSKSSALEAVTKTCNAFQYRSCVSTCYSDC